MSTTITIFAKITQLAVESHSSTADRILFTFVLFGVFGIGMVETVRGINHWAGSKRGTKSEPSKDNPVAVPPQPRTEQSQRNPLQDPVLHFEPERDVVWSTRADLGQKIGIFDISLHNTGLEDVDVMELSKKYFLAQRGKEIIIKNIRDVTENSKLFIKSKNRLPIHLDFNPYLDTIREVAGNFTEGPSRAGVYIVARCRRHADGKDFTFSKAYGIFNFQGPALFTEGSTMDVLPIDIRSQFLTLHEVIPYLDSPERWTSVTREVTSDANGDLHSRLH